jgi:AbrB family looped-hinge helix DNA binding protein
MRTKPIDQRRPSSRFIRTVSSKGQIGLPIALRRRLGWKPGDKLHLTVRGNHCEVRLAGTPASTA